MINKIFTSSLALIGNTPVVNLSNYCLKNNIQKSKIFAKLEYFNPFGSSKDRPALYMIENAKKNNKLKHGSTIIEPTSGNTGIAISAISKIYGYNSIIVMPESISNHKKDLLKSYGAKLVLTKSEDGMPGSLKKAKELLNEINNSIMLDQFNNINNSISHELTTGPELFNDLNGNIDYLVAGVGTGGTITGTGRYLKKKLSNLKVVAVEPSSSPFLSKGIKGKHKIEGIGAGFIPKTLDTSIIDQIITVDNNEAFDTVREISNTEGLFLGISSGAAICAATKLAKTTNNISIAVICPDSGQNYL